MAMCQREGFSKEEDVGLYCQSDLPSCLEDTSLHWVPPKLARATLLSLGGLHSTPCVLTLVRFLVDADEALSQIRHLWKIVLKSCHTVRSHGGNGQVSKIMSQGKQ